MYVRNHRFQVSPATPSMVSCTRFSTTARAYHPLLLGSARPGNTRSATKKPNVRTAMAMDGTICFVSSTPRL